MQRHRRRGALFGIWMRNGFSFFWDVELARERTVGRIDRLATAREVPRETGARVYDGAATQPWYSRECRA